MNNRADRPVNPEVAKAYAKQALLVVIGGLLGSLILFGLQALIIELVWNSFVPEVFHLASLTYLQALGVLVICRILTASGRASSTSK